MQFNDFGLLAPGDYELTIPELKNSLLVKGPEDGSLWDENWRLHLVEQLEIMVKQLWSVGLTDIYIDRIFCRR